MKNYALMLTGGLMIAAAVAGGAVAQESDEPREIKVTPAHKEFIQRIHELDLSQIQLGRLAEQRVQKASTLVMAVKIIQAHTSIEALIGKLTAKELIALPAELSTDHVTLASKLNGASEKEFDYNYINAVIPEQQKTIEQCEAALKNEPSQDYLTLINAALPLLRDNLKSAQDALKTVNSAQGFKFPDNTPHP